jgi:hypothetical protein
MVQLKVGQAVPGYDDYTVLTGGEYKLDELVVCVSTKDPERAVAFQANYIVNGVNFGED